MGRGEFPTTRLSRVLALRSVDPTERARSFEALARAYHPVVYKYVRVHWKKSDDQARDLTQDFFAEALERGIFAGYESDKARFRTFVRVCLDRFIGKKHRAEKTQKRGGDSPQFSFDFEGIEAELSKRVVLDDEDGERYFEAEWVRSLMSSAVLTLRRECEAKGKSIHFQVFERLDLCPEAETRPSYGDVAKALGISVTDVTNRLSYARRELRRVVLDELRELTASEDEFREEAWAVLGIRI
jgi:RNA polymerase sigma factor (sigma-70 family)